MSCVGQLTVVRGEWPPWPREMALGIISRTSTSPGLIESSRVTKKFSPEFQFNLSQKELARQANNKRRKPKVTPARLPHSKLSLKLHAPWKRNTYLQSHSSHSSSAPVLRREPTAVTIKQLCKNPTLSAHFSEEIEWLGVWGWGRGTKKFSWGTR